jgi:hypothetical protein
VNLSESEQFIGNFYLQLLGKRDTPVNVGANVE